MMTFCEANLHTMVGKTIVSNIGNRYSAKDLSSNIGCRTWFNIPSTTSMTKSEREGKWRVE